MKKKSIRDPGPIVDQIIEVAKKHDIYKESFKCSIDDLVTSIRFSAPEVRYSVHFYGKLYELMCAHFPPDEHQNTEYFQEFGDVIQGR